MAKYEIGGENETIFLVEREGTAFREYRGFPGPPGPAGQSDAIEFTRIAATAVSGHRVVSPLADGTIAYISNNGQPTSIAWVTTHAALAGEPVSLIVLGAVSEPSWSWTPGEIVWLGMDGMLTQTTPVSGRYLLRVGYAESPTTLFVNPGTPIVSV